MNMSDNPHTYQYIFGPVASRRYALSLGVDLAVPKTCSLNCLFCQLGETARTTVIRQELPPIGEVLAELEEWIRRGGKTDFITVAGSGEPTLHKNFGAILSYIRNSTPFRSLLLSNGSLFYLEDVRRQAKVADVVKLSLHAWDQSSFERIARPAPELEFGGIIEGYQRFRADFAGRIDLEVFVVPGLNDTEEQMTKIAAIARTFAPDSIYLNSAVRPPADASVREAAPELMDRLNTLFGTPVRVTASPGGAAVQHCTPTELVRLIARHPASLSQLADQFNLPHDAILTVLKELEGQQLIRLTLRHGELFATPAEISNT